MRVRYRFHACRGYATLALQRMCSEDLKSSILQDSRAARCKIGRLELYMYTADRWQFLGCSRIAVSILVLLAHNWKMLPVSLATTMPSIWCRDARRPQLSVGFDEMARRPIICSVGQVLQQIKQFRRIPKARRRSVHEELAPMLL